MSKQQAAAGGGACGCLTLFGLLVVCSGVFSPEPRVAVDLDSSATNISKPDGAISAVAVTAQVEETEQSSNVASPPETEQPLAQAADESESPVEDTEDVPESTAAAELPTEVEAPEPSLREWKDSTGNYTTVASFVSLDGETVSLRKESGNVVTLPVVRLSEADQYFVRSLTSKRVDPDANVILGVVVSITDGDTVVVLDLTRRQHKIRLEGIDAPERRQDHGTSARKALASMVINRRVRVEWKELDKYGRTLGHIYLDDRWINKDMVQDGWAWHYKEYSTDVDLAAAEVDAIDRSVGLWRFPSPIPPWDFRNGVRPERQHTETKAVEPLPAREPEPSGITVYVTSTGSKYHRAGCQYLRKSRIPVPLTTARSGYGRCSRCRPP